MRGTFALLTIICVPLLVFAQMSNKVAASKSDAVGTTTLRPVSKSFAALLPNEEVLPDESVESLLDSFEQTERRKDMCIAAMIDGEAGDEPVAGQYLAGYVGHMRAVEKWFGSDNPCVQVCKTKGRHREFDGTKKFCAQLEVFRKSGKIPAVSEKLLAMAREIRSGVYLPEPKCRKVRYFFNPAYSSPGGIKYFAQQTKLQCIEGGHVFAEEKPPSRVHVSKAKAPHQKAAKPVAVASSKPAVKKLAANVR